MKIYTKTGDKGTSALFTGDRLDKNDHIFECLGSLDELNAHLGLVRNTFKIFNLYFQAREYFAQIENLDKKHAEDVEEIQARLIDLGSQVATPRKADEIHEKKIIHTSFDPHNVTELEKRIDYMDEKLPPLKNFILPSGGLAASHVHVGMEIYI